MNPTITNPLAKDLEAFNKQLPTLQQQAGKFAVFIEGKLEGVFDTNQEAFEKAYAKAGLKPFLVRQITTLPTFSILPGQLDLNASLRPKSRPVGSFD
jgi:hypothetical protein